MHKDREELLVAVHVGAVKIYVAAVEALREKMKDRVKLRKPYMYSLKSPLFSRCLWASFHSPYPLFE
jgi:hypothetical protein